MKKLILMIVVLFSTSAFAEGKKLDSLKNLCTDLIKRFVDQGRKDIALQRSAVLIHASYAEILSLRISDSLKEELSLKIEDFYLKYDFTTSNARPLDFLRWIDTNISHENQEKFIQSFLPLLRVEKHKVDKNVSNILSPTSKKLEQVFHYLSAKLDPNSVQEIIFENPYLLLRELEEVKDMYNLLVRKNDQKAYLVKGLKEAFKLAPSKSNNHIIGNTGGFA
jgi:hypothetical protein